MLARLAAIDPDRTARVWSGPTPEPVPSPISSVAAKIGLSAGGEEDKFVTLSPEEAGLWLALFGTQSLVHGGREAPAPELVDEITSALAELGPAASFFSNGEWQYTRRGKQYERVDAGGEWRRRRYSVSFGSECFPLPPLKFVADGGVIGIGLRNAFIFWLEEHD